MKLMLLEIFIVLNIASFILNSLFASVLLCQGNSGQGLFIAVIALCNGLLAQDAKKKKDFLTNEIT